MGGGSLRASVFLQGWGALLSGEATERQEQGSPRGLAAAVGSPHRPQLLSQISKGPLNLKPCPCPWLMLCCGLWAHPHPAYTPVSASSPWARPTAQLLCVHTEWAQRITHFLHLLLRRPSPEASSHLPKQPPSTLLLSSLTRCPQAVKSGGGGGGGGVVCTA